MEKLNDSDRKHVRPYLGQWKGWELTPRIHKGLIALMDRSITWLCYMTVYICQNSSNYMPQVVAFYYMQIVLQ